MRGARSDGRSLVRGALIGGSASLAVLPVPGSLLAQDTSTLPQIQGIAPAPAAPPAPPAPPPPAPPPPAAPPPAAAPPTETVPRDPTVIDRDKVPSSTQTLTASDFERTYTQSVTEALMQRVPGVSTTDVQGNGFTQDLRYRGFAASPLQGTPQGMPGYMAGIRLNERGGDTVN